MKRTSLPTASAPTGSAPAAERSRRRRDAGFRSAQSLLDNFQLVDKGGYITQEFQDFGYRLAVELNDLAHKSLYMRLAKRESRGMLEAALSFVKDAPAAKSKARLFMWKVKALKQQVKEKRPR